MLITGANGGIGKELCAVFSGENYRVIALGLESDAEELLYDAYLQLDLDDFCSDEKLRLETLSEIHNLIGQSSLKAIINNAALQIVKPFTRVSYAELLATMNINVFAPYLMVQGLLATLRKNHGSVVNISSIHAALTKPGFSPYAISKTAMDGMTRALAVELGSDVRINAIAPAAISTPMLEEGFKERPEALRQLADMHPTESIGKPADVASLALYLVSDEASFINGSILGLDGGIRGRLHDPV